MSPLNLQDLDVLRARLEELSLTDMDAVRALTLGQVAQETGYPGVEVYALHYLTKCAETLGYKLDPVEAQRRQEYEFTEAQRIAEEQEVLDAQKISEPTFPVGEVSDPAGT